MRVIDTIPLPASLADQAYDALIGDLRAGRLASGTFVSMPQLVAQMSMPIAAVREAVKRAEACGLVTIEPKRGVLVMDAGVQTTRACLDLRAIFDAEGARRLVAQRANVDLAGLRAAHQDVLDQALRLITPELPGRAIAVDLSLHDALSGVLENPLALRLYDENRTRVAVIQNTRPFLADRIVSAMQEHLAIISALEVGDVDAAVQAVQAHLEHTLRWWGVTV